MFLVFVVACFVLVLVLFRFLFPALVLIAVLVSVIKLTGWWPTLRKMGPSAGDAIVQVFVFLLVFVFLKTFLFGAAHSSAVVRDGCDGGLLPRSSYVGASSALDVFHGACPQEHSNIFS